MMTKVAYLVVAKPRYGLPVIRRAMQSVPRLEAGEAYVRVALDLPDDFFTKPLTTIEVEPESAVVAEQVAPFDSEEDVG